MKILQQNLNRSTFVVWEMKRNVSVVCVCSAPNCCDTELRSASQPASVASGTPGTCADFLVIQFLKYIGTCQLKHMYRVMMRIPCGKPPPGRRRRRRRNNTTMDIWVLGDKDGNGSVRHSVERCVVSGLNLQVNWSVSHVPVNNAWIEIINGRLWGTVRDVHELAYSRQVFKWPHGFLPVIEVALVVVLQGWTTLLTS